MLCFTFLSWVSAAVLGLLPCSAMLLSLITGQLSLYFTMVQSPPSPALLHIPPPATVKYSGCLAAAAAAQLPVSFTPVLRLTAACSLVTARPSLCCRSSGRGSRCRWRAAAGCSWCAESCQCVTNSSSAGAACGPGGVRAGTGVQPATVTTRGDTRHRRTAAPQLPVRCTLVTPPSPRSRQQQPLRLLEM